MDPMIANYFDVNFTQLAKGILLSDNLQCINSIMRLDFN